MPPLALESLMDRSGSLPKIAEGPPPAQGSPAGRFPSSLPQASAWSGLGGSSGFTGPISSEPQTPYRLGDRPDSAITVRSFPGLEVMPTTLGPSSAVLSNRGLTAPSSSSGASTLASRPTMSTLQIYKEQQRQQEKLVTQERDRRAREKQVKQVEAAWQARRKSFVWSNAVTPPRRRVRPLA